MIGRGLLGALVLGALGWAALVGLVVLCSRVAGGPNAWKVGVLLVAVAVVGFVTRERL